MSLLPRERVFQTLDHQEPDRVPTALGGGPYGVVDEVYHKLVDLYDLGAPVPPFRNGHSISFMDDRLLDKLGTDIRYVFPNLLPNSPIHPGDDDDSFMDSYGQVWHRAVPYYYAGEGLLSTLTTGEDISSLLQFPDPHALKWMKGVSSRAEYLRTHTDHFVTMRMVASHGPFQTACDFKGH